MKWLGKTAGWIQDYAKAYNNSAELLNQLLTIDAATDEAMYIIDLMIQSPLSVEFMRDEARYLQGELENGIRTQDSYLFDELIKIGKDAIASTLYKEGIKAIKKTLGIKTVGSGVTLITKEEIIFSIFKIAFSASDYLFQWKERANAYDRLRVLALFSVIFESEVRDANASMRYDDTLRALKYLIKIRIEGEKAFIEDAKSLKETEEVLVCVNELTRNRGMGSFSSLDDYYLWLRTYCIRMRDILFGDVIKLADIPDAPEVGIDCVQETTEQAFDADYEYSRNGVDWIACDGNAIDLLPETVGGELWVRMAETSKNRAGNITKIDISPRPRIVGSVHVRYKDGCYFVDGLTQDVFYSFQNIKDPSYNERERQHQDFDEESGRLIIRKDEADSISDYMTIILPARAYCFESQPKTFIVEKSKTLNVLVDENEGHVSGYGEYFDMEEAELTAHPNEGYEFLGWYQNEVLLSSDRIMTYQVSSDVSIEARFVRVTNIVFQGWQSALLINQGYPLTFSDPAAITIPSVPMIDGYRFVGWRLDKVVMTEEETRQALIPLIKNGGDIIVDAVFEQLETTYHLTIKNGEISGGSENGKTSGDFSPATLITIKANKAKTGMKFAYWMRDGMIISYDSTFSMRMTSKDTTVEAVYVKSSEDVEKLGTAVMEKVNPQKDIGKISFVSLCTVPEGSKIIYAGIVATSDEDKPLSENGLTAVNADYVRGGGAGLKSYRYTWTKAKVTEAQTWFVRPYLKYSDVNGAEREIYGDMVIGSLRTKVTFLDNGGKVLSENEYGSISTTEESIILPNVVVWSGYRFLGWEVDGALYTDTNIKPQLLARIQSHQSVSVKAVLEQKDERYQAAVVGGKFISPVENSISATFQVSELVKVKADAAPEGKKFAYWEKDGIIVGYEETYSFRMPETDTVLTAIFEDQEVEVEAVGTTFIESWEPETDTGKLVFVSVSTVPDGCRMEFAGLVATSDLAVVESEGGLTKENAAFVRGDGEGLKSYKYTWKKTKVSSGTSWYVRAYLRYTDKGGNMKEVYGDVVKGTMP